MADYKLRYYAEGGATEEVNFAPDGVFENDYFTIKAKVNGERYTVTATARKTVELIKCTRRGVATANVGDLCLINGYQSWTKTKEYFLSEKERDVNKIPKPLLRTFAFDRYGDTTFFDYDENILHGYDLFYVKKDDGAFIVSANYKKAYLIIVLDRRTGEISLRSELDGLILQKGESFTVADYYLADGYDKGIKILDKIFPKKRTDKILGYTSWYNYYQNINEEIILRDLEGLDERFDLFQIDDGYENFVGDWMEIDVGKFPRGLRSVVEKIHAKGFKAGIWLAPFVAESKSRVFKEHPDWFDFDGQKCICGANWSGFYSLNLEKKGVKEHIATFLKFYVDMGFDFFKLDFLYGANLPLYKGKTRCQVAEEAYDFIREILKGKLILGCGATIFNAANKFEYMRIGPDVSLKFDDVWYMKFMHNERISTKVTLQNTIYRSLLNGRIFGNDPDVFLLRDDNISLSAEQKRALITLNALFGSVLMTSDDIGKYDDEKKNTLAAALDLFRNGKALAYRRNHDIITIAYELRGVVKLIDYDYKKGVIL